MASLNLADQPGMTIIAGWQVKVTNIVNFHLRLTRSLHGRGKLAVDKLMNTVLLYLDVPI